MHEYYNQKELEIRNNAQMNKGLQNTLIKENNELRDTIQKKEASYSELQRSNLRDLESLA